MHSVKWPEEVPATRMEAKTALFNTSSMCSGSLRIRAPGPPRPGIKKPELQQMLKEPGTKGNGLEPAGRLILSSWSSKEYL